MNRSRWRRRFLKWKYNFSKTNAPVWQRKEVFDIKDMKKIDISLISKADNKRTVYLQVLWPKGHKRLGWLALQGDWQKGKKAENFGIINFLNGLEKAWSWWPARLPLRLQQGDSCRCSPEQYFWRQNSDRCHAPLPDGTCRTDSWTFPWLWEDSWPLGVLSSQNFSPSLLRERNESRESNSTKVLKIGFEN